jgi:magnesium-transporting ATPase (P-type)
VAACHAEGLSAELVRTVGFVALIAADLALVVATASGWPRRGHEVARNPAMVWMFAAVTVVVAATICVPWSRALFEFAAIDLRWIVIAVFAGAVPVAVAAAAGATRNTRGHDARSSAIR